MYRRDLIGISMILFVLFIGSVSAASVNYITLENKFNARMEITDLYVVDLDKDGSKEVIASSYDSKVYLLDSNVDKIWQYDARAYVYSLNIIDLEKDGRMEIVAGSSRLQVLDFNNTVVGKYTNLDPVKKILVEDFDNDGFDDMVIGSGSVRSHTVYIFNNEFEVLWQKTLRGEFPWGIAIEDLDGDGRNEVVIGGSEVFTYDADKNLIWSFKPDGAVGDLRVDDIDNDGKKEVLVGSYPTFYVLAGDGKVKWEYKTGSMVKSIHITDLEDDGVKEIAVGSDAVYLFNSKGDLLWSFQTSDDVNSIHSGDLNWDGIGDVAIGSKKIYVLGKNGSLQWEYEPYRAAMKLLITDVDNDGRNDLIVAGLDHNVYLFKAREIYIKEMQSYSLYTEAEELYDEGEYISAKSKIEEAIGIRNICNVGKCKEEPVKCDSLLQKIDEKIASTPTTTMSSLVTSTTTTIETMGTTTTLPGEGDSSFIVPAVLVLILIGAIIFYTIRKR
jgi:hypothetical protein